MVEEYAAVDQSTTLPIAGPMTGTQDILTDLLRDGARRLLAEAVEAEVAARIDAHAHLKDQAGRRQVVRNGYLPGREIQTGLGDVEVKQPRVHDRRPPDQRERFTSAILPPYLKRTKSLEELIPWLYLKGVSTGDFSEALQALLGPDAPGLSATTITRLKAVWEDEFAAWNKQSLAGKRYVYVRADGAHFNVRLEGGRQCILVLMGATAEGKKELIDVADGYRESEQSWKELLLDCEARGLTIEPSLAVGDGALGFWKAIGQVWPSTRPRRCWVHRTSNFLDKLPKGLQPKAKAALHGRSTKPRRRPTRRRRSTCSWRPTRPSTRRRRGAWPRAGRRCRVSTTSRPSTGGTSAPPTRSSRRSPRCGCGR
jgi:putative transposase